MATVIDYISEIRNELPKDYPNITNRSLINLINEFRAIQIKNELNQNKIIPKAIVQTISGIQMEMAAQIDVPFITDNSRILKSKQIIPNRINLSNRELVTSVYDGKILSQKYNLVTPEQAIYSGNGRGNQKKVFCFIYNNYLYIKLKRQNTNISLIANLTLEGIFENPLDLIPLQYSEYFDFLQFEYPISMTMWAYIKSNILKSGLNVIQAEQQEKGND